MEGKEKNHNFSSILFGLLEWYEWQNHVVKILYIHTYIYIYIYMLGLYVLLLSNYAKLCVLLWVLMYLKMVIEDLVEGTKTT